MAAEVITLRTPVQEAFSNFEQARHLLPVRSFGGGDWMNSAATEAIDITLDRLLGTPSLSFGDFRRKLLAIREEYGLDIQPRHFGALLADAQQLEIRSA